MNPKISIIGLAAMGLIAAFSAALLMASMRTGGSSQGSSAQTVKVLIAKNNLTAHTAIKADMLEEIEVAADEAPDSYLSNTVQVVGKVLVLPVMEGQPLRANMFADDGPGAQIAAALNTGYRAVSVTLDNDSAMQGLLYPGGNVDVIAAYESMQGGVRQTTSKVILQGVQVLAVGDRTLFNAGDSETESKDALSYNSNSSRKQMVTLMVDASQAKTLQLAMRNGRISLALRNPLDDQRTAETPDEVQVSEVESQPVDHTPVTVSQQPVGNTPWQVTIFRGEATEVKQFDIKTNKPIEKDGGDVDSQYEDEPVRDDLGQAVHVETWVEKEE